MRENLLTDNYYFDTDCLSAFLWIREESLLAKLYPGRIVLPMQVYNELKKVPHLLSRIDTMKNNGTLASNNLRDIKLYVDRYSLKHITKGDILIEALHKGYITEKEGNVLWEDMLRKKRMLPTQTFTDFLKKNDTISAR
jgi:hypothetical protein